jgi:hypothetical protein
MGGRGKRPMAIDNIVLRGVRSHILSAQDRSPSVRAPPSHSTIISAFHIKQACS